MTRRTFRSILPWTRFSGEAKLKFSRKIQNIIENRQQIVIEHL